MKNFIIKVQTVAKFLYHNQFVFMGILALYLSVTTFIICHQESMNIFLNSFMEYLPYILITMCLFYGVLAIGLFFKHYKVYWLIIFWLGHLVAYANYLNIFYRSKFLTIKDFIGVKEAIAGIKEISLFHWNPWGLLFVAFSCGITVLVITYKTSTQYKKTIPLIICSSIISVFLLCTPMLYDMIIDNGTITFATFSMNNKHERSTIGPYLYFYFDALYNRVFEPNDYDEMKAETITDKYTESPITDKDKIVIVILNESWADFNHSLDMKTNVDCFQNYKNLNAYKGYVTVSQFGGYTCNAEYEFLTGNSMFFLPSAHTVYTGSINEKQDSIVSYLNKNNFNTIAISGADRNIWSVEKAYQALQFKEYYFEDDLTIEQNENTMLNGHIRDIEMYKELIKHYEQNRGNQFYFLTTMQNHAYYDKMENPTIIADEYATNKELQTYLNLVKHTDEDIRYLIDYFKNSDKDVTIAMFGDHFPFLTNIYNMDKSEEEPLTLFQTPFFIWNNKRTQSQYNDMISLNYLANEVFKVADLPLSKQQQEVEYIRQTYPLICAFGYVTTDKQDSFIAKSNVVTEIQEPILHEYWCYQYNNMTKEETK